MTDVLDLAVSDFLMPIRHRKAPDEKAFQVLMSALTTELGTSSESAEIPKRLARRLLDLVGLMLIHAADNPDEGRVIDLYVEIDEMLMAEMP